MLKYLFSVREVTKTPRGNHYAHTNNLTLQVHGALAIAVAYDSKPR